MAGSPATGAAGKAEAISTPEPLAPLHWTRDGKWIVVQHLRRATATTAQLSRLDVASGQLKPWKVLQPADPLGVNSITGVVLAEDCETYVYSYRRVLSELFAAQGWR